MPSQCASVISLHVVTRVTKPQHQNETVLTIHEYIVRVLDPLCWPPRAPTPDPWTLMRPSPERVHGRHACKSSVSGRRSAVGLACSTSPSVESISSSSAEMCGRTRKEVAGLHEPPLPTLMLEPSEEHPKCAGSLPAWHSTPWTMPLRVCPKVSVSPAFLLHFRCHTMTVENMSLIESHIFHGLVDKSCTSQNRRRIYQQRARPDQNG